MREKLIELLNEATERLWDTRGGLNDNHGNGLRADHLIANGVTVQEWIPASEPPKDTCEYWIAYKAGGDYYYTTGYFDGKCWCSALTHHKIHVTHWMPLPEPPKGE